MKYYKIIVDNTFIGVVHSGLFVKQTKTNMFYSNESRGQYVNYNGILYHDYWMQPVESSQEFIQANITEITENEYNIYIKAIQNNETIIEDEIEEEPSIIQVIPQQILPEIEYLKQSKINEMSHICRQVIESGFDLELRGEIKHFSLNTQDQLNLMSLGIMAQSQSLIPYHADGEEVLFYDAEEINEIVDTANAFKIYHTTYYNSLKNYINSLETIEEIAAIEYGIDIPEEYQTDVLKALGGNE